MLTPRPTSSSEGAAVSPQSSRSGSPGAASRGGRKTTARPSFGGGGRRRVSECDVVPARCDSRSLSGLRANRADFDAGYSATLGRRGDSIDPSIAPTCVLVRGNVVSATYKARSSPVSPPWIGQSRLIPDSGEFGRSTCDKSWRRRISIPSPNSDRSPFASTT